MEWLESRWRVAREWPEFLESAMAREWPESGWRVAEEWPEVPDSGRSFWMVAGELQESGQGFRIVAGVFGKWPGLQDTVRRVVSEM